MQTFLLHKFKIFFYGTSEMTQTFPNRDELITIACEQTGLTDFGDTWFMPHLDKYIECLETEA